MKNLLQTNIKDYVMKKTLSDKIIESKTIDANEPDSLYQRVQIDGLLGHDATIALLADKFDELNLCVWDPSRVIFTNDHFSPPATSERADISNRFIKFSQDHQIGNLLLDKGICHQLLVEHPICQPGALIVGADSHTIMGGALGACATGMGSTDILYALATGTTWLLRPESIKVVFRGSLPPECSGRDVILELMHRLGEEGAQYRTLEFHDLSESRLNQDDRFAIANMAVECGGKFGIFVPDEITEAYLKQRDGKVDTSSWLYPDSDAVYLKHIEIDLDQLSPRVAKPWSPSNVVPIEALDSIAITTAFLGSCSSGRLRDIADAAEELEGKTIHPRVRFVVIPASQQVFQEALSKGYVLTLTRSGAVFNQSSCGPCGGIDKGVLGAQDVCVSTSNRNFRGRMGHWESQTYLASARTVAKAALTGALRPDLYIEVS